MKIEKWWQSKSNNTDASNATSKEAKKEPIPLRVSGKFVASITSAKKKEKKSQAKKSLL